MSQADKIRAYANRALIEPARNAGRTEVAIDARDIHKDLRLRSRMPAVCGALDAKRFQDDYRVALNRRTGPLQGSAARWIFSLKN